MLLLGILLHLLHFVAFVDHFVLFVGYFVAFVGHFLAFVGHFVGNFVVAHKGNSGKFDVSIFSTLLSFVTLL
jgi:hypothetical protein